MLRRRFRLHGPFASEDSNVTIPGATPPTVPMKKKDLPAPKPNEREK